MQPLLLIFLDAEKQNKLKLLQELRRTEHQILYKLQNLFNYFYHFAFK